MGKTVAALDFGTSRFQPLSDASNPGQHRDTGSRLGTLRGISE